MDALSDRSIREIWVMKSAQVGWTEILGNVVGYHMHLDPCPILMIQPTVEMGQAWSKDRLDPMLRDTPVLNGLVSEVKGRTERGNTVLHKLFKGGHITITGANSAAGLASRPIRLLLFDEVDRFPVSAGEEGDPITLAKKRTAAFHNRRILGGSTPTTAASRINQAFLSGDQRRFFVPCVHCGEFDYLRWSSVTWKDDDPETARLVCPHCGGMINDLERMDMIAKGEWRATAPFSGVASFHVWEAYNTMVKLSELVRNHLEQVNHPEQKRTWTNTSLGEPYEDVPEAPDWASVAALRQTYQFDEIPAGVRALTCGVDVQKDRLIYAIRGWGVNFESWLIRHGELWGETEHDFVWGELGNVLATPIGEFVVRLMLVDSGYRPGDPWRRPDNQIYGFCRARAGRVFPTKGHDQQEKPYRASRIDITVKGKMVKAGLQLWHLDTDYFKTWLYSRFDWPVDQPGGFHLPVEATDDYCQQITAEAKKVSDSGAVEWVRVRKANHYLDCEVLNIAAAHILGVHLLRNETPKEPSPEVPPPSFRAPQRKVQMPKQSYVKRGRY
jgi:phage terminase large subunit GpA-like protein